MIRPARFTDAPELQRIIRNQHPRSKYAGRCGINEKALESMVLGLIAGMGQNGPQASHIAVNVEDGKVVGFIAGTLSRIYGIFDRLAASDAFLINEGRAGASLQLVDSYIAWARANPKVLEISLSWTDVLPGAEKVEALAERKGFARVGGIYAMALDAPAEMEAA